MKEKIVFWPLAAMSKQKSRMGLTKRGNSNALERSPTILVSTVPAYELDGFGEWGVFFLADRAKEGRQ